MSYVDDYGNEYDTDGNSVHTDGWDHESDDDEEEQAGAASGLERVEPAVSNVTAVQSWWDKLSEGAQEIAFRKLKCADRRSLCMTNKRINETWCRTDWHREDCYAEKISGLVQNLADTSWRVNMTDGTAKFEYSISMPSWKVNIHMNIDIANGMAGTRSVVFGYYSKETLEYRSWESRNESVDALPRGLLMELSQHLPKLYEMLSLNTFEAFDALAGKDTFETITPGMFDMRITLRYARNVDAETASARLREYAVMYYYRDVIKEAFVKSMANGDIRRPRFTLDTFNSRRDAPFNAMFDSDERA